MSHVKINFMAEPGKISMNEKLFLGVLIEFYFLFPRIIFIIFNFSILEKPSRYFRITLQSLARML